MENLLLLLFSPFSGFSIHFIHTVFWDRVDEMLNTKNLKAELPKLLSLGTPAPTKHRRPGQESEVRWMTKNEYSEARKSHQWYLKRIISAQLAGL